MLELGLQYKREFKVGNYPVDFYIPMYKLSIQCDGCYWHGQHSGCRYTHKNSPRRQFQARRDKACTMYHKHIKNNILRVHECQVEHSIEEVKLKITSAIKSILEGKPVFND